MVKKLKDKIKNQRGAIVVEASISLTAFMFFIVVILSIVNICYVQAKIGVAVNTTAKEISEYSYLYELTGLRTKQADLYAEGEDANKKITNTLESATSIFSSFQNIDDKLQTVDSSNLESTFTGIQGDASSIKASSQAIESTLEDIFDDPKAFALGIAALAGNHTIESIKSRVIAGPLSKMMCMKHLTLNESSGSVLNYAQAKESCNDFLGKLHIEPANGSYYDGLDFNDSVLFLNGSEDIMVIVHYRVKVLNLLGNDITLSFTQSGTTRGWIPISDKTESTESTNATESTAPTQAKLTAQQLIDNMIVNGTNIDTIIGVGTDEDKSAGQKFEASYLPKLDEQKKAQIKENLGSRGVTELYEAYIDERIAKGGNILCTVDPATVKDVYLKQQIQYLQKKGYTFEYNEIMGVYMAKK